MTFEIGLAEVLHALLGSVRVLVMMLAGPIFSHPALSMRVRVMASLMVAWVAAPEAAPDLAVAEWAVLDVASAIAVEFGVGLAVGVGSGLVFAGILQLGEFVAIQGGLGAARSIDPTTGAASVAIGMAFNTFAMLIFLAIGGHHDLIRGIVASYDAIPVGGAVPDTRLFDEVTRLAGVIWRMAFQLAAPISISIFVQNMCTGVLARAMPQLNLLLVNLPLHVGMMLFIIGFGATEFVHAFKDILEAWPAEVVTLVLEAGRGG